MSRLIPVKYHKKNYPIHIEARIHELAGNFDKEELLVDSPYSLHTEYSYMPRKFESKIIKDLVHITSAQRDGVPQLWYNEKWGNDFFIFLERLIDSNNPPEVLEIHPPFNDYCNSFDQFLNTFNVFYNRFANRYPTTIILIENRCGTLYKGGRFLLSTCSDILDFCDILSNSDIDLKLVLDYPQILSAELVKMDDVKLDKVKKFNLELSKYKEIIGGFHMWGKRKSEKGNRWTPHTGNLNTLFSNNDQLKHDFLNSIFTTFNDDIDRYFVPEVNSGEDDLHSIVTDMEQEGFVFTTKRSSKYQLIRIKWDDEVPSFELFNHDTMEITYKQISGNMSICVEPIKYCIGSYELGTHKHIACKNNSVIQEKKQCKECENLNGFTYCVSCHGEKCYAFNEKALDYCNQKHFVYLAYFPDNIIKVGTAHELRKEERLLEQGALYRILIAEVPTGKLARQIEAKIAKLGYKSSVSSKYKIQNLFFLRKKEEVYKILDVAYNNIKQYLDPEYNDYFLYPYITYDNFKIADTLVKSLMQSNQGQRYLFDDMVEPKYNIVSNVTSISGNIIAVIGNIALFRDSKNIFFAYDFKEIIGRNIIFI
jgi:hypothetical protein